MRIFDGTTYRDMTEEELTARKQEQAKAELEERTRPRTQMEGIGELVRTMVNEKLSGSEDKTLAIACMAFFEPWTPGVYAVGDIRTNPGTGYPRECMTAHDSTVNPNWTITTASLWKPYHSRKKEYALPWETPTGAHDIYKTGEYMVWTDGNVYHCKSDTNFSPADYADAWELA